MSNIDRYTVNDRLTELAQSFGVEMDDDTLNELTHHTADVLEGKRTDDSHNGWTNRETWAVALHINNDQGWQESVLETVRNTVDGIDQDPPAWLDPADRTDVFYANRVGDAIRENVEEYLDPMGDYYDARTLVALMQVQSDLGSLWRVDWSELGAAFLADLTETGDAAE